MEKSTNHLTSVLANTKPNQINEYLGKNSEEMMTQPHPFSAYLRQKIKENGLRQQDVFLRADIPEHYGYKLISEERHTRSRDIILRLCFAANLTLDETQRALTLYGFAPLYPRITRDAILISAKCSGVSNVHELNQILADHGEPELKAAGKDD